MACSRDEERSCHALSPKLIAPKMGTETLKPLLPSRLYSALVLLIDSVTGSFLSDDIVKGCLSTPWLQLFLRDEFNQPDIDVFWHIQSGTDGNCRSSKYLGTRRNP